MEIQGIFYLIWPSVLCSNLLLVMQSAMEKLHSSECQTKGQTFWVSSLLLEFKKYIMHFKKIIRTLCSGYRKVSTLDIFLLYCLLSYQMVCFVIEL